VGEKGGGRRGRQRKKGNEGEGWGGGSGGLSEGGKRGEECARGK